MTPEDIIRIIGGDFEKAKLIQSVNVNEIDCFIANYLFGNVKVYC